MTSPHPPGHQHRHRRRPGEHRIAEAVIPPVVDPEVSAYLATATNRLTALGDDIWGLCRDLIIAGNQQGWGVRTIAERIIAEAGIHEPRARVIARTEINRASNAGAITQMRMLPAANATMTKEWLATDDGRTRSEHLEANGQRVALDDPFIVGGEAVDAPGDGSPANAVNCRCTVLYDIPDDASVPDDALMASGPPPGWGRSNVDPAKLSL